MAEYLEEILEAVQKPSAITPDPIDVEIS